jgi:hypothetical protein
MRTTRKVSLICNIIGGLLMITATVFWIISLVKASSSLAGVTDEDVEAQILQDIGWWVILGVALPLIVTVLVNIVGMMAYVFDGVKTAGGMFFFKLGMVVLPLILLAVYLIVILQYQ